MFAGFEGGARMATGRATGATGAEIFCVARPGNRERGLRGVFWVGYLGWSAQMVGGAGATEAKGGAGCEGVQ